MYPNQAIIEAAKAQARLSTHRFRVGAVFYIRGEAVGRGFNDHIKTHPKSPHPFNTKHAEFSAFMDWMQGTQVFGNWNFSRVAVSKDMSLYVHRLKADGSPGLAKPCQWCWGMLNQLGISKVYWSLG